MVRMMGEPAQ